ncbi:MAG: hypothetical protein LBR65_03920 [Culturomica sp.]|jgi:hypothetical protein|nr:hypothetical protein [Culturomica sp.]
MKITVAKKTQGTAIKEVKINPVTVQDIIDASRLSGGMEGAAFMAALLSQICEFDGEKKTYEDVTGLAAAVFFDLSAALVTSGVLPSEGALSTLSGKDTSPTKG